MAHGLCRARAFGVLSAHQGDKTFWFNTVEEQDAKVAELSLSGFELRHGIYIFDHEKDHWV